MPLTEKQINDIKYVSMKDFCARIDLIEDINDKLTFASNYLLMHGMVEEPDVSIQEAINIARMKIVHASINLQNKMFDEDLDLEEFVEDAVNPYAVEYEDDAELELFVGKPAVYLKGLAQKKINEIDGKDLVVGDATKLKDNYQRQFEMYSQNPKLGNDLNDKKMYYRIFRQTDSVDDLTRFYGGKNELDQAFDKTKPGFFSRMFGTSSKAYSNLDACYKAYFNPNHVDYRNSETLEKAAGQYIQHKFPNWEPGDPFPSNSDIDKLDATSKERILFSISVFKATEKGHEEEEKMATLLSAHRNTEATFEQVDGLRNKDQQAFQEKVVKSLDDSMESEDMEYSDESISVENDLEKE